MTKPLAAILPIGILTLCGTSQLTAEGLSPDNIVSEHHWEVVVTPSNQSDYGIEVFVDKRETARVPNGRDISILVKEGPKITRLSQVTFDKRKGGKIQYLAALDISDCGDGKCVRFLTVDADAVDRETYVILCDSPTESTTIANYFVIPLWDFIHGGTVQEGDVRE